MARKLKWDRVVRARGLLTGDDSNENAVYVGKKLAEKVAVAIPENDPLRDEELTDILERLNEVVDCDDFNSVLYDLYDWGDVKKRLFLEL